MPISFQEVPHYSLAKIEILDAAPPVNVPAKFSEEISDGFYPSIGQLFREARSGQPERISGPISLKEYGIAFTSVRIRKCVTPQLDLRSFENPVLDQVLVTKPGTADLYLDDKIRNEPMHDPRI